MTREQIVETFTYHSPTPHQNDLYVSLREHGKTLALAINDSCPESREKSIALTKVQEAIQMANASIAIHTNNGPFDAYAVQEPNTAAKIQEPNT